MSKRTISISLMTIIFVSLLAQGKAKSSVLSGDTPVVVPGKAARFDFMQVDSAKDRLLATHSGAGSLEVVDLKNGKVFPPVAIGMAQGVAVDESDSTYILGDGDEHKIVFVNANTLRKKGEVKVSGPVDAIAFNSKNGYVYAGEDDGNRLWVIDAKKQSLIKTIPISGVPEFIVYDPKSNRLYQNIKTKNSVAVINPESNQVEAEWSTLPAEGPHGLAIDSQSGHLFVAGHNGKLAQIEIKTGKVISQVEIAPGADQISFDASAKIIYCASQGFISAAQETESGLKNLGDTPTATGAHTLSVDPIRHDVWISFADKEHSYLQKFKSTITTPRG